MPYHSFNLHFIIKL